MKEAIFEAVKNERDRLTSLGYNEELVEEALVYKFGVQTMWILTEMEQAEETLAEETVMEIECEVLDYENRLSEEGWYDEAKFDESIYEEIDDMITEHLYKVFGDEIMEKYYARNAM